MQEQAASPEQGPGASWLCLGEQQSPWPLSLFSTGTWELTSGSNFCLPGLASEAWSLKPATWSVA